MTSQKLPALQFYPGDWKKDPGISMLDITSRGIWFELLLLMHESSDRGLLLINGAPPTPNQVARSIRCSLKQYHRALTEILRLGIAEMIPISSRNLPETFPISVLASRRMIRDEKTRKLRKDAGSLGGNPILVNQHVNLPVNTHLNQNPTPSSSSSVSTSNIDTSVMDPTRAREDSGNNFYNGVRKNPGKESDGAWLTVLDVVKRFGRTRYDEAMSGLPSEIVEACKASRAYSRACDAKISELSKVKKDFISEYQKIQKPSEVHA